MGAHIASGIATTALVFPRARPERKRALVRRWSRKLLRLMNIEARLHGAIDAPGGNSFSASWQMKKVA